MALLLRCLQELRIRQGESQTLAQEYANDPCNKLCPEAVGSAQATTAFVDSSASLAIRHELTYRSGKVVHQMGPFISVK
ncbi:hypothetical protein [Rhodoferax sp.]|uniref:hypothetical protein n=1 Tax=Rhodoferax sp. TaxID=50421 RepID=UPI0026031F73|nr:hypothetical protein [Rhodoferax sp.]MDD2919681.1 hypothetical protein [Rhodoferax sp.]